ncbi:MAG: bile acid:sodium symporter family protein [Candidatus Bathyarchaeia archaeon]
MGLSRWVNDNLLVLVIIFAIIGVLFPQFSFLSNYVGLILFVMILGLGLTITLQDFVKVVNTPQKILAVLIVQYSAIPIIAFSLTYLARDRSTAMGILIIGSAPSEITSALMVYLAGGNLALATAIMGSSILVAPFIMPLLLSLLAGESVVIDTGGMLKELLLIVALPVIIGSLLRTKFQDLKKHEEQFYSLSSVMVILLIFTVASGNAEVILNMSIIWLAVLLLVLNLSGYLIGFITGKLVMPNGELKTYMFTIGMKEFGVGAAVALQFFDPEVALPSTVYGIIMLITAPILVRIIKR